MNVGIPRERFIDEARVALSPAGVRAIVEIGATVYVEHDAGEAAGWTRENFEKAGAKIVYNADEAFGRADLVLKVLPPSAEESTLMHEDQVLMCYLQLPLAHREMFDNLVERRITAIGLENVNIHGRGHPVRRAMSEIAGALAVYEAARYLGADSGGRGILMGGVPGVPPASVGILGGGVVGTAATEAALNMGAHVILADQRVAPLREAINHFGRRLQTALITEANIEKICRFVDVLIGAVLVEDYPTPHIVSREMVRSMKPRSVIVDVAIDQGGTVETSHPTSISNPVFTEEGVIHYCVPNMPAKVPRTSTRAFQNQVLRLVKEIVKRGPLQAFRHHAYLSSGINLYEGVVTRESVAKTFGTDWKPVGEALA